MSIRNRNSVFDKKKLVNVKFLVNNSLCFSLDQEFDYGKQSRLSSLAQFCDKEEFFQLACRDRHFWSIS